MADRSSDNVTRQRLLEAAGEIFAEVGFHAATVRDICARASANVAAVNYHFGGKDQLYEAVLRYAHRCSMEQHPPDGGLGESASAEERLRAFVHSFLQRLFDTGRPAWHQKLVAREMIEPTAALGKLVNDEIRPRSRQLQEIVRALVGSAASEEEVRLCGNSVVAQCLFYHHARPLLDRLQPEQRYALADVEALAEHVMRFCLAALKNWGRGEKGAGR